MSTEPFQFFRAFPAELETKVDGGRRTLTGRLVPYDVPTYVLDIIDGQPKVYEEGFRSAAFEPQLLAGSKNRGVLSRIGLIHRHEGGLGYLGPFVALRSHIGEDPGLYGSAMVLPTQEENVAALLEAGVQELSVEFRLRAVPDNTEVIDGVHWRKSAHLDQVALEPKGAYTGAQVLSYREQVDEAMQAEAEAAAAAEQDECERAEAERAREEEAEARIERRRSFDEMTARHAEERAKQDELIKKYGLTIPPMR